MKEYNPDKDIWQWSGRPPPWNRWFGGKCYKVKLPDLTLTQDQIRKQIDNEIYRQDMKLGSNLQTYGIYLAIACIIIHGATKASSLAKVLSRGAEWGIVAGVMMIAAGLLKKQATRYEYWLGLGAAVVVVGIILYVLRDHSVSHIGKLFNRKKGKTPAKRNFRYRAKNAR